MIREDLQLKLNLGCGRDKKLGWINIDGNEMLQPDMVIDLGKERLTTKFSSESCCYILASDIVEHLFHWQAVALLKDLYELLVPGGTLEVRVPDFEVIIGHPTHGLEKKINCLFGGQDTPQGETDLKHRLKYPEFYCHKFSYTKDTMRRELEAVGFKVLSIENSMTNMIVKGEK